MARPTDTRPAARRHPRPGAAARVALLTGGLLLGCLAIEVGLRLFAPVGLHPTDTFLVVERPEDPEAGKTGLVANSTARHRTAEFDFTVRINSRGLRDREFSFTKPPGVYRILVLGDSHTFGWGVEMEETYARRLERRLNSARRVNTRVEVINCGVPAMGTAHQILFLETEGWRYRPDAILLGFFFNDVNDNAISPLFRLEEGRLVRRDPPDRSGFPFPRGVDGGEAQEPPSPPPPRPAPPGPSFWVRHSHLARLVRERSARLRHAQAGPPAPRMQSAPASELTAHLLAELARLCREHQARLLVALLPANFDCSRPASHTLLAGHAPALRLLPDPERQLHDLMPAFRAAGCAGHFFRQDGHINRAGHRVVAEAVAVRLLEVEPRLRGPIHHR